MDRAKLRPGCRAWVDCEVKPGPFSNERIVRIVGPDDVWLGFVHDFLLREPILTGQTAVEGIIDEVAGSSVWLFLPGAKVTASMLRQEMSKVSPYQRPLGRGDG